MKTENETSHVTLSHAQVKTTGVGAVMAHGKR